MNEANTVGVRELRNQVAAIVRRAAHGDRMVITVDGHPLAQLTPIAPVGEVTLGDLAAAGLVQLPGRADKPAAPDAAILPIDVRADPVLGEVRG